MVFAVQALKRRQEQADAQRKKMEEIKEARIRMEEQARIVSGLHHSTPIDRTTSQYLPPSQPSSSLQAERDQREQERARRDQEREQRRREWELEQERREREAKGLAPKTEDLINKSSRELEGESQAIREVRGRGGGVITQQAGGTFSA